MRTEGRQALLGCPLSRGVATPSLGEPSQRVDHLRGELWAAVRATQQAGALWAAATRMSYFEFLASPRRTSVTCAVGFAPAFCLQQAARPWPLPCRCHTSCPWRAW